MKLTREERRAIMAGDYRALKRSTKPPVKAGQALVISWTRGGRQVVDRETGATVEIPRNPSVWIEFKEPQLRRGDWIIQITGHDERQRKRFPASTPNPGHEPALKTRWREPDAVPGRGEYREPHTSESARGYTGSARVAVDHLEAVDDECLRTFAAGARNDRVAFREELEAERADLREEARRRRERGIQRRLRDTLRGLEVERQAVLLAEIERLIELAGSSGNSSCTTAAQSA